MTLRTATLALGSISLVACLSMTANAALVFNADFAGSPLPDVGGIRDLTATAPDLNAGTSVGSWSFDGTATDAGILNIGTGSSTPALAFDDSEADVDVLTGTFSTSSTIGTGSTVTYAWDWALSRTGGNKEVVFSALSGATSAYQITWQASTRNVFWVDTDGDRNLIANLSATSYFRARASQRNPALDLGIQLVIADGGTDNGDGTGTGATISLDTNNDGTFDLVSVIGPSTEGLTSLDGLSYSFAGTGNNKGQHIAEVSVNANSSIPEPTSLAVIFGSGVCVLSRHRRNYR